MPVGSRLRRFLMSLSAETDSPTREAISVSVNPCFSSVLMTFDQSMCVTLREPVVCVNGTSLRKIGTIHPMDSVGSRIKKRRQDLRIKRGELATRVGMPYSTLADVENERIAGTTWLAQIAKELGCSAYYLQTGDDQPQETGNVADANLRGRVPLVSKVQAGAFREVFDEFQPGDPRMEWVPSPIPVRRHTFALRVEGDSMEPDFPDGYVLFVEPDAEPVHGSFVIAKNGDNEATFKQLIKDGPDWYLKPLNPRYPIKPLNSAVIIGVVKFSGRFL